MKCSRFFGGHFWSIFRVSLGKIGKKSFAPSKICLLLHLWMQLRWAPRRARFTNRLC